MLRQIYIVNATQAVVSESHPEGTYTTVNGYPIKRDSRDYEATETNPNGNEEIALIVAQADYADAVKQLSLSHNRAAWAVTLTRADGRQIMCESRGAFPDMTPAPEPAPEESPTEE